MIKKLMVKILGILYKYVLTRKSWVKAPNSAIIFLLGGSSLGFRKPFKKVKIKMISISEVPASTDNQEILCMLSTSQDSW
jgi:hypothetical protein